MTRENHREAIAGRADVEDTPELLAYYDALEKLDAGALWTVANKIEPWQPKSTSVPVLWRYEDLRAHVLRSVELVTPEKAGPARRLSQQSRPYRARRLRRLVVFRPAGHEPRRSGVGARAFGFGASLHHGGCGRLHDRRRPQDDARRQRLRADAQRHVARAWRGGRRHALHLAGWTGHSAGQRARGEFSTPSIPT